MPKENETLEIDSKENLGMRVKRKRKNAHPVRKYFARSGETQQKCTFCGWHTVENATRMVQHIANRCADVPDAVRNEIAGTMLDAEERLQQSSFTNHNKKAIHNYFRSIDNDRKRCCVFCKWTTVLNLTRMRQHITQACHSVPTDIQQSFIKQDYMDESECDTYCIINVDDGDRKGLQVVSSSALDASNNEGEQIQEVVINAEDEYDTKEEGALTFYEETVLDTIAELNAADEDSVGPTKLENEHTEVELLEGEQVGEELEHVELDEIDDLEYVHIPEGRYYTANKGNAEKRQLSAKSSSKDEELDEPVAKRRPEVKVVTSRSLQQKSQSSREEQIRKLRTRFNVAEALRKSILVKKEPEKPLPTRSTSMVPKNEKQQNDAQPRPRSKTSSSTPTTTQQQQQPKSPQETKKPMATSTPFEKPARRQQQEGDGAVADEPGSCHSFGGGHVYPQEAPRFVDHKLQYTKAVISRPAPAFEATAVVDGAFKKIKLSDYRGKYLVFFFYPLDFTFVCPTEILAFSDRVNEFKKLNAEVIAASIDSHFTHLAWINTPRKEGGLGKINIPLVSDITHSISKDYGVFLDDLGHTLRGLFIIDDRGVLRQITMNDLPVGRSVDETLRLVQAFQYTDKHGEVCPAGWKPGQDTIVPNPEEKIKYFEKNH
ncbi:uncharacterized protein LOC120908718 [Anopheles arabiensis]|uniref:uncharacterized protein LOC120908718 n=1 Tax=Anopheles arabiensis TaxID=7173 RepID=UPI001AAD8C57|nr:uncharacterized protein LOC120908718 [Anopheles arabiensis]